jgi:hypothetical protein
VTRLILLLLTSISMLVAGCRTDAGNLPSVASLQSRLGRLTFDEAVRLMGSPTKRIELDDHSSVAEWEAGTESGPSFSFGLGSSSGAGDRGVGSGATIGGAVTHIYRQLQFDQAGRLVLVQDVKR